MSETKLPDIVERLREEAQCGWHIAANRQSDTRDLHAEAAAEITHLRERLEMTHAWKLIDGKMQRVAVELDSIPDGIECRDETIKLQDAEITRLRSHAGWHEAIEAATLFLIDRLTELEIPEELSRDWMGHVEPAIVRLQHVMLDALLPPGGEEG